MIMNTQLLQLMSLILYASVDALSQPCKGWLMYIFLPFLLLNKVCQKIQATCSLAGSQNKDMLCPTAAQVSSFYFPSLRPEASPG